MNPRVNKVYPLDDYKLRLEFKNGEVKLFDMAPYLTIGVFKELTNKDLFKTARANLGSVTWQNGQDLCPDTLYLDGIAVR